MSQIEKKLRDSGWTQEANVPLILGMSLLHLIDKSRVDDEGKEHTFQSATLFHKGDRYVFSWTRWDQLVMEGRLTLEEHRGTNSDGATHFNPEIEAVSAGFSHVLTIGLEESAVHLWRKTP